MKNTTIKLNLIILAVISLIIGILYIFIGSYFWIEYLADAGIAMIVEGVFLNFIGFGLFTKHILPDKKGSFFFGFFLGIIGIIIAICIKHKKPSYKGNKYDDLAKLQKLKEDGVLTEEEFNKEKEKLLK